MRRFRATWNRIRSSWGNSTSEKESLAQATNYPIPDTPTDMDDPCEIAPVSTVSAIPEQSQSNNNGKRKVSKRLLLLVIALIFCRAADQALYYRIAYEMNGYTWYFSAIILPIAFLVILWPIVWFRIYRGFVPTFTRVWSTIKTLAVLGLLDTLFNLLSTFPVRGIGGTASVVLSQAVVPFQLALNWLFLGNSFKNVHYLGALLAIYGVLVRMIPRLEGNTEEDDGAKASGIAYVGWLLVMIASAIPNGLSNVFKEKILKRISQLDVYYMNAWVGMWQLFFGILTIPTVGLKFTDDYVPLDQFGSYVSSANDCFLGHPTNANDECGTGKDGVTPIWIFFFYIAFNIAYNILMLIIFREGSSVIFVVASTVRLPLVDVLLMIRFISGPAYAKFSLFDGFALFALVLAIATYNSEPEIPGSGPRSHIIDLILCKPLWRRCFQSCSRSTESKRLLHNQSLSKTMFDPSDGDDSRVTPVGDSSVKGGFDQTNESV